MLGADVPPFGTPESPGAATPTLRIEHPVYQGGTTDVGYHLHGIIMGQVPIELK